MGIVEILTIILALLKLLGEIDLTWFQVFLPEMIAIAFYLLWAMFIFIRIIIEAARFRKHWDRYWDNFN
jgi:hypothetical protein